MKTQRKSFTGERPIFTGSPSIVQGGFNLDVANQAFAVGDIIAAGTPVVYDEQKRVVLVIKAAKVVAVNATDAKIVTLKVGEFYQPCFAVGDKVLKTVSGTIASAPSITNIEKSDSSYIITLSAAIEGLAADDVLVEVVANGANADWRGYANGLLIDDVTVREYETPVDVTADTMQYALLERRVLPIPAAQKNDTGAFLKANPHVKFSQSY